MNDWMEGYSSDTEYTAGYYKELDPNFLNITAVLNGIEPISTDENFHYCELGCGQGITALILAANYPNGTFYAIDYNPSHIAQAQKIAQKANLTNITFLENSFQDLVDTPSILPKVDFMVFHGIYTWVNETNRSNLIELCNRHVKSGGLVYNSYNAKPGWNNAETLQKLLFGLSNEYKGSTLSQIDKATEALDKIKDINMGYLKNNKEEIERKITDLKEKDKHYLVHEYLHEGWRAFYFPEVSKDMSKAKLSYLSQASPAEVYSQQLLPSDIKAQLNILNDQDNRELLMDIVVNRSFRKDIYTRGISKKLNQLDQYKWFANKKWILIHGSKEQTFEFKISIGTINGNTTTYSQVIEQLEKGIFTTKELEQLTSLNYIDLIQVLILLYNSGYIGIYTKQNNKKIQALNKIFADSVLETVNIKYVIAGHVKGVVNLNSTSLVWLSGIFKGLKTTQQLVEYAYNSFTIANLGLIHENKHLTGDAMKARLYELETSWRENTLPLWIKLGIINK